MPRLLVTNRRRRIGSLALGEGVAPLAVQGVPDLAVAIAISDDVSVLLNRGLNPVAFDGNGVVGSGGLGILLAAWGRD